MSLKVLVCCTFGAGSSMILKANLDQIFLKMKVDVDIEVTDLSSLSGRKADLIFTSRSLVQQVSENIANIPIIPIKDYFDLSGIEENIAQILREVK